jgi:hypothetical protein
MPNIPVGLLIDIFAVIGAAFALWKGGPAERMAAIVVVANVAIGEFSKAMIPAGDNVIRLINDGLTAIVLLGITLRFGALWMGGMMLFYAAQFAMHSYYLVTERRIGDYMYALTNNINFSGIIWCLIIGTVVAWRGRLRRARAAKAAADAAAEAAT